MIYSPTANPVKIPLVFGVKTIAPETSTKVYCKLAGGPPIVVAETVMSSKLAQVIVLLTVTFILSKAIYGSMVTAVGAVPGQPLSS